MQSRLFVAPGYPHRMNQDGTIDSICPRCYATIGTSTWEADLERIESSHVCEPARLSYFEDRRRKPMVREETPGNGRQVALPVTDLIGTHKREAILLM
jgi:hypothetical protein